MDRLGLVIFASMGLLMGVVTELHRRYRHKAAAYDREAAVRESQARLAAFAEATFEGIVQSEAGRIVDCNEQLARMLGYSVAELAEATGNCQPLIAARRSRDRVMANIRQPGRASSLEHAMLCKDGTRIVVEAHGRPVSPAVRGGHRFVIYRSIRGGRIIDTRAQTPRGADRQTDTALCVLSRVNETIVRARDAETARSREVCRDRRRDAVSFLWSGSAKCRGRQVVPVASAGSATEYLEEIQIEIDGPLGAGPGGTCIRENPDGRQRRFLPIRRNPRREPVTVALQGHRRD